MKAKVFLLAFFTSVTALFAQDRTTVTATTNDISDNLDLRAVASIFGDSENLEDFERRLNDPKTQISNLDLNRDNQVDYLRVIESVEGNTHLIIVQSVLDRDIFQDVATIEVERGANNQVQVQVVGDVYMYGSNYIYEPVYVHTPIIYGNFWGYGYHPYYSSWYWGYYPSYYYAWNPCPSFRYRNHIHSHINTHHHYNYVNVRRSERAVAMYGSRRSNGYERRYPERSFTNRNVGVSNRHELAQTRGTGDAGNVTSFANSGTRANPTGTVRNNTGTRSTASEGNVRSTGTRITTANENAIISTPRSTANSTGTRSVVTPSTAGDSDSVYNEPRAESTSTPRDNASSTGIRSVSVSNPRTETSPRQTSSSDDSVSTPRSTRSETQSTPRVSNEPVRTNRENDTPRSTTRSESPRASSQPQRSSESNSSTRSSSPSQSSSRSAAPQSNSGQRSTGSARR